MMIDESRFRRILREEARKILNEEVLSGVSAASVAAWTGKQAVGKLKTTVAGSATGLGSVSAYTTAAEGGAIVITGTSLGAYIIAAYGIAKVVETFDETLNTLDAAKEAADRNTKQALSLAKGNMFLAGIESGKRQGLFTSPTLTAMFASSRKDGLKQKLSKEDRVNMGVVYSLLTSAEVDKAFQDAAESVTTKDSGKYEADPRAPTKVPLTAVTIPNLSPGTLPFQRKATRAIFGDGVNQEVYDRTIAEFKSKLAALQSSVNDQIVSLKANQAMRQAAAAAAATRKDPAWLAQQKEKQDAYAAQSDAAMFKAGMVPSSYKPVPVGTAAKAAGTPATKKLGT
jgi:hypothetical protein